MHPNTHVTQVEISTEVVELAKLHFSSVCGEVFSHKRHRLVIADGKEYVANADGEAFDIVLTDLTDPIGPAAALFEAPFYRQCRRILRRNGILVTQTGVPFMQGSELTDVCRALNRSFADVTCYLVTVPTYVGGQMALGWASDDKSLRTTDSQSV